ncbi:MAG: hypothetical protein QM635_09865 [Microbacteriaceae bacterium]
MENYGWAVAYSLAPTILLGLLFWFVMRSVLRADRTEREVYASIEAEERAALDADGPAGSSRAASPAEPDARVTPRANTPPGHPPAT